MKHIRYTSDNKTLCHVPQRLGYDFVVIDTGDGSSCKTCTDLLFAWNMREYERESRSSVNHLPPTQSEVKDFNAARGVLIGMAVGTIMWVLVYMIYGLLFR